MMRSMHALLIFAAICLTLEIAYICFNVRAILGHTLTMELNDETVRSTHLNYETATDRVSSRSTMISALQIRRLGLPHNRLAVVTVQRQTSSAERAALRRVGRRFIRLPDR